ncbi:DUF4328 domain-containing protein [Amycolatopsis sp. SID8362]|uniref:DUF4328 domain-containing protein n=1 Tax=Amycolatopsis sp. SID8362 TaxID=2690346 RepID=UPI001370283B|nr:DUF4328 domain-containing protein [Amycolatopsis sp. SID8362]NBH11296.1 DUF4328 domain-containing protein [Amycolatopsis sp. SID8362]NED47988.1 DUF4328 domain-containing protein [Amycolatopsis sp. SID8362]
MPRVRPLAVWQSASAILIIVTTAVGVADVAGEWGALPVSVWLTVDWTYLGIHVVTGIVFVRWLWLARANAEVLEPAPHRHSPAWAVFGWIVPIVSFWFPQMVVRDVWNASNPQRPRGTGRLFPTPGGELISWWWAAYLTDQVLSTIGGRLTDNPMTARDVDTVAAVAEVAAAALVIMISARVTAWQENPS